MGGPCVKVAEHGGADYGSIWAGVAADQEKRAEMWKRLCLDARCVLSAHAVGFATQVAIGDAERSEMPAPKGSNQIE